MQRSLRLFVAAFGWLAVAAPAGASIWPGAAVTVERDLTSDEVTVRQRAALRIGGLPRATLARVALKALKDPDVEVRVTAAQAALEANLPGLSERLLPWLTDSEPRLRLLAAESLTLHAPARAVGPLIRALADTEASVRRVAASALGETGASEAVVGLLGRLDDPVPEVREAVVRALTALADPRAVVPLISKIEDQHPAIRRAVALALGALADPRAVSALVLSLRDSDATVRVAALEALSEVGGGAAVATIISVFETDTAPSVRRAAIAALGKIADRDSVQALIRALASAPELRSDLVNALGRAGALAEASLRACLQSSGARELLEPCALALAHNAGKASSASIRAALARGAIGAEPVLVALARAGDADALPTALAYLTDPEPNVRRAARQAARALLDPARADGRAVEPLEAAFAKSASNGPEALELLELLGRTGAGAAARLLLPLAEHADDLDFRLAAIQALGELRGQSTKAPATQTLLKGLADPQASVRLAAALALRRAAPRGVEPVLLDRLERAAAQDRRALAIALSGGLSQVKSEEIVTRLTRALERARGAERDTWIEVLARVPTPSAQRVLAGVARGAEAADRAKVAEVLALHPSAQGSLLELLRDREPAVRANAAWSLGWVGTEVTMNALLAAAADPDAAVAANASAALGRVGKGSAQQLSQTLCAALATADPAQQLRSLGGLRSLAHRCAGAPEQRLILRSPAPRVRLAAARLVRDVEVSDADRRVLRRCAREEARGDVALACAQPPSPPRAGENTLLVFVVPSGESVPTPRAAFGLARPDAITRYGYADRRGAVFETHLPEGNVELVLPASSLE